MFVFMFMFMFMFMFVFVFMFMFMFMFMLSHVIPYAKHPLEIPPLFSLRIFWLLPEVREFIKDTRPKTNTTRGGRKFFSFSHSQQLNSNV